MIRPFIILTVLVGVAAGAPRLRTPDPDHPVGNWRIRFANGVIQTCQIANDGSAAAAEPLRQSPGKWKVVGRTVVITFDDDRIERWTKADGGWTVEHWCPTSAFGRDRPVVGTARRE